MSFEIKRSSDSVAPWTVVDNWGGSPHVLGRFLDRHAAIEHCETILAEEQEKLEDLRETLISHPEPGSKDEDPHFEYSALYEHCELLGKMISEEWEKPDEVIRGTATPVRSN